MDARKVIEDVKESIRPSGTPPAVTGVMDAINKTLRKQKVRAVAKIGGSFAKDTWLAGDHDVDIFVAFDTSYEDSKLSDMLEKALKPLKAERVHGSRDYFQVHDGFTYEIIPVRAI